MTTFTPQQLSEIYKKLPNDLKEAYFSAEIAEKLQEMGKTHKLNVWQTGELSEEVGLIILGISKPDDFIAHLSERLEIGKEEAEKIASDANAQIFTTIRETLRKMHEGGGKKDISMPAQQSSQKTQDDTLNLLKTSQTQNGIQNNIPPKEDILKEIEKVDFATPKSLVEAGLPTNPFEAKFEKEMYRAPTEEKVIEEKTEKTEKKDIKGYAGKVDPYREQTE